MNSHEILSFAFAWKVARAAPVVHVRRVHPVADEGVVDHAGRGHGGEEHHRWIVALIDKI